MANVEGTPSSGMFVGYPASNPMADAFSALATSMAARKKYDMDNQNARINAMLPQLAAGMQFQPPEGASIQDLMSGTGLPATNGVPWGIGANPKNAMDALMTQSNMDRNTQQNKTDAFKMSPEGIGIEGAQKYYQQLANNPLAMRDPKAAERANIQAGNTMEGLMALMQKNSQTVQANAPTQIVKSYSMAEVRQIAKDTEKTVAEVLAHMRKNKIKLAGQKPE